MYNEHFGFNESPFSISPDPRFLYLSERHRDALAHLVYGAGENGGFVLLTGPVGTGKTTLIRSLLEQELDNIDIAMCLHSGLSTIDFVASVLDELHISYPSDPTSLKPLVDALNQHLLSAHAAGRQTVLVIDEGQNLSREVLEQIRLLTNLETNSQKLLRIILVGQEELQDIINRTDLRQLSQRITMRYHLTALNAKEVSEYIAHRLKTAKGNPSIFSAPAVRKVYQLTHGVPRLINVLCDRALLTAYNEDAYRVSSKHIRDAAQEILPQTTSPRASRRTSPYLVAGILALTGLGYAGYQQTGGDLNVAKNKLSTLFSSVSSKPISATTNTPQTEPQTPNQVATAIGDSDKEPKHVSRETSTAPKIQPSSTESEAQKTPLAQPAVAIENNALKTPSAINNNQQISGKDSQESSAAEKAENKEPTLINIFEKSDSQTNGISELLKIWNLNPLIPANRTACQFAENQQMSCLNASGGYLLLKTINRPALLELADSEGNTHWLAIKSIKNQQALCIKQGKSTYIPISHIMQSWTGNFTVLLNKPKVSVQIQPGFEGEQTRWLRERLAIAENKDYTKVSPSIVFDQQLVNRVKDFQKKRLINIDGIIGNETLLHLYNVVTDEKTPVLSQH